MRFEHFDKRILLFVWVIATATLCGLSVPAHAQQVTSSLSAQEAFVDSRIVFHIRVTNGNDIEPPTVPFVDGLKIQSAAAPSRSSNLRIVNGKRWASTTTTYSYFVIPQREGEFTIPAIKIKVDGKIQSTSPHTFVASKSETGDLLFVEVISDVERAFVGQPVKLKLRVWIRPFVDRDLRIRLSEANMWSLISEQTTWGPFADRLVELADQNRRPGGAEVLRKDSDGVSRAYFSYDIEATIYPRRAETIGESEVRIVVDYPTKLARSRGSRFFGPFMIDEMLGRTQYSVQASRPISAIATLPSMEILDVPVQGRPDSYRGAVGKYKLLVQADPTSVRVGEPISLKIVIQGDGPMELVEPPPLADLPALAQDFKVDDKSLAGFVQNDVKVFATTIRPKSVAVKEIPRIDFSFFDPNRAAFNTVSSQPIPIAVSPNESLSLDSIVAARKPGDANRKPGQPPAVSQAASLLSVREMMSTAAHAENARAYWPFAVAPVAAILGTFWLRRRSFRERIEWIHRFSRNPAKKTRREILKAKSLSTIRDALDDASGCNLVASAQALAVQAECDRLTFGSSSNLDSQARLETVRQRALTILPLLLVTVVMLLGAATGEVFADPSGLSRTAPRLSLTAAQTKTILEEARRAHLLAREQKNTDPAAAQAQLETAIQKYELVAESGLLAAGLYRNLGDAYVQNEKWARALAAFEKAKSLDPVDLSTRRRIEDVQRKLGADKAQSAGVLALFDLIPKSATWTLAIGCWSAAWMLLVGIALRFTPRHTVTAFTAVSLLVVAAASVVHASRTGSSFDAITVGDNSELRAADGDEFAVVGVLGPGEGVLILGQRGKWLRVESADSQKIGWIRANQLQRFRLNLPGKGRRR